MPDVDFETDETYILTLFIRRSTINRLNLMIMNGEALITILDDDSESHTYYCLLHLLKHVCMYFTDVIVNLQSQISAVTEGSSYVVNVSVEPTTIMASFNVIVQTYFCGGCNGANRKQQPLTV